MRGAFRMGVVAAAGRGGGAGEVVLLMHFDGSNGSTTFTDSSGKGHVFTQVGGTGTQISTAQSKFGGASLICNASSYLTTPDSPDWAFGAGDFTIEGFIYPTLASGYAGIVSQRSSFNINESFEVFINYPDASGKLEFDLVFTDATRMTLMSLAGVTMNAQQHFACVRKGAQARIFMNGVAQATATVGSKSVANPDQVLAIGALSTSSGGSYGGYLDELRINKGGAVYWDDFTPPTAPFPNP